MNTILCPTRGGERSYPNQNLAIRLAQERDADILFFYVADVEFLGRRVGSPLLVDVEAEMEELGEFMLAMAQERAARRDVPAGFLVRHGVFSEALRDVIEEEEIATVVLGTPEAETGITTMDYLQELANALWKDLGVEVLVADAGHVVLHLTRVET